MIPPSWSFSRKARIVTVISGESSRIMASKFPKKVKNQDNQATARPRTNYKNSAPDNGESTPPKPKSKPKFELKKLETATTTLDEVFQVGDLIQVKDLKSHCDLRTHLEAISTRQRQCCITYREQSARLTKVCGYIVDIYAVNGADWCKLDNGALICLALITAFES